jgi:transcriptional regulator with XRE-family HTH domain
MDARQFGSRLKELREQAGLSQKDLAVKAGLGQKTISNWEQAISEPVWSNVVVLAGALGVSCEVFQVLAADREPQGRGRPSKPVEKEPPPKRPRGRPKKDATGSTKR